MPLAVRSMTLFEDVRQCEKQVISSVRQREVTPFKKLSAQYSSYICTRAISKRKQRP
jgi:hypothetical protein